MAREDENRERRLAGRVKEKGGGKGGRGREKDTFNEFDYYAHQ